jgi:alanine dehydrogenase
MDIGVIKERRLFEHRVGLTPGGVRMLVDRGARVWVETGAGIGAGFSDEVYREMGATIGYSEEEVLLRSELVLRVSAPEAADYRQLQPGQVVLASWHLAVSSAEQFATLLEREVTAVGYEILEDDDGRAPVLQAMGEIAGRLAVIVGSGLMLNEFGGKGLLICGAPGIPPASLVVLGAGTLGSAAAQFAHGIGAHVVILDRDVAALRRVHEMVGRDVPTMIATPRNIAKALGFADMLVCAVAVHGERSPILVTRDMLRLMKPRSIIMDLAIDQGGCCETSRPTDFSSPTFEVDGIIHFCVPNLASTASRASTRALTAAMLPYLDDIVARGFDRAVRSSSALRRGTYTYRGHCVRQSLAEDFGVPYLDLSGEPA